MADIRFYHLQRSALEKVLPQLLRKTHERGWRAVVLAGSPERVESLCQHLWTYDPASFLPHGSERDGDAAEQPIYLTHHEENPNGANVLMLVDGMDADDVAGYGVVCDIFDGRDDDAVAAARRRWKVRKGEGHEVSYWQEGERGGWERKA